MGLFKSKEDRELEAQEWKEREGRKREIRDLKAKLDRKRRSLASAREFHQQSLAQKWEYLELSNKNTKEWGSLDKIGSMGWELVSATTYAEGYGDMTVFTLYVFKRPIQEPTPELMAQLAEIEEIESQVTELEGAR